MNLERIKKNEVGMILQFAIPSIIAMVLTSLITITDGFFIGNYVGEEGIAAVNLGLPILYLYLGIGLMLSVGGIAIAGMALGAGELKKANHVFNQTVVINVIVTICLSLLIFICFQPIMDLFQANEQVKEYFKQYYMIMLLQFPVMILNSAFGMFIRGEGNPQFIMKVNVLNVICNVIFDYITACCLNMGIQGIAISSVVSTLLGLGCNLCFLHTKSKIYKLRRFEFSMEVLKSMVLNGSSEFIGEFAMSISMFAYNFIILKTVGVNGVAAFTIVGYISYIFSMIIVGFGQGASPLLSFTYGAKERELCISIRKITNLFVLGAGMVVIGIMLATTNWYSNLFVNNKEVSNLVRSGMMIFVISFLFSGINTITSFYFTSIGKAKESAVISSSRGLIVLLICIFTLPVLFGMNGVWMVAPITEGFTLLLSMFFIIHADQKDKVELGDKIIITK